MSDLVYEQYCEQKNDSCSSTFQTKNTKKTKWVGIAKVGLIVKITTSVSIFQY